MASVYGLTGPKSLNLCKFIMAPYDRLRATLRQHPVFGLLPPPARQTLYRAARLRVVHKGDVLAHQGQVWPRVAVLLQSRGQWVLLAPSGRRQVVFHLGPGQAVWGHSLFDDGPLPASFEITEAGWVFWWPRAVVRPLLTRHPEALWALNRDIVGWMRRVRDVLYALAFQDVMHRVARVLVEHYPDEAGEGPLPRRLTLEEMAALVGTSPEFVCRVLRRLSEQGLLDIQRRHLIFKDRAGLERLARGE